MKLQKRQKTGEGCGLFCLPLGSRSRLLAKDATEIDTSATEKVPVVEEEEVIEACPLEDEFEAALREDSKVGEDSDDFQQLPPELLLNEMYKVQVLDKNRNKVFVKTLYKSKEHRRHIIVFIRHFFCGMCYSYVKALSEQCPPEVLAKMNPPTTLSIIGCGDPILIPQYVKETGCAFEIYADPSRSLYNKLGFAINTDPAPVKPDYVSRYATSLFKNIMISLGFAMRTGKVSGGMISQNGGEMIWIDGQLQFIHRMKNSQDHTEVVDMVRLLKKQGIEQAKKPTSIRSETDGGNSRRSSWARYAGKRLSAIFSSDTGE